MIKRNYKIIRKFKKYIKLIYSLFEFSQCGKRLVVTNCGLSLDNKEKLMSSNTERHALAAFWIKYLIF